MLFVPDTTVKEPPSPQADPKADPKVSPSGQGTGYAGPGDLVVPQSPCPSLAALQGWVLGQTDGCQQGREHAVVLHCLHSV